MKNKFLLVFFIIAVSGLTSACGFRMLNGNRNSVVASGKYRRFYNISRIYVKPFKNLTYKSGIGVYFSNNIAYFLNTETVMFTANKSNALYYLTGNITSIRNSVISYTGVAAAVNYMITVTVTASMYKTDGKIIFNDIRFSSSTTYYNYINPLIAHEQEKRAILTVSKRIARKIMIYIESKRLVSQ